jgi:hypothetical protein
MVWAMTYGEWPDELDHINGIKHDNRIANLRQATPKENAFNRGAHKNNTSGYKGVCFYKKNGKYQATVNGIYLGRFDTPELAHAAYCAEADRLHGEFVNHGTRSDQTGSQP